MNQNQSSVETENSDNSGDWGKRYRRTADIFTMATPHYSSFNFLPLKITSIPKPSFAFLDLRSKKVGDGKNNSI